VGVVVLEEWNQGRGNRDELLRRHVHVIDAILWNERYVALLAGEHELVEELAALTETGVRLRDDRVLFLVGVEPRDLVGHLAVLDDTIRRLDESEIVDLRVARERR